MFGGYPPPDTKWAPIFVWGGGGPPYTLIMPPHCMSRVCIRVRGSYQAVIPFPRHGKGFQKLLRGPRWHLARLGNGSVKLVKPPLSGHLSERDPREERCRRLTVPPQGRGRGQRLETNWLSLLLLLTAIPSLAGGLEQRSKQALSRVPITGRAHTAPRRQRTYLISPDPITYSATYSHAGCA